MTSFWYKISLPDLNFEIWPKLTPYLTPKSVDQPTKTHISFELSYAKIGLIYDFKLNEPVLGHKTGSRLVSSKSICKKIKLSSLINKRNIGQSWWIIVIWSLNETKTVNFKMFWKAQNFLFWQFLYQIANLNLVLTNFSSF